MTEENRHFHNSDYGIKEKEDEKSEFEKCRKQAEEYLNGWKRAKADYLNLKKEMEAQNKEIKEWLSKVFLLPLLDIMDNFDRVGTLDAGIENIKKQFEDFLTAQRVEPLKTEGEKFDPIKHEAVESIDGPPEKSGMIAEEIQKGYLIGDEVLRSAKVKVYK